ncbi:hypothetical protein GCM10009844_22880 [Nocardioides koreensis]|uniref:Uncharacterized protein n=1 Tax=Nocardioides koreensis TaxID=433651 RepID=A0ABN2ZRZ5_9ACTN
MGLGPSPGYVAAGRPVSQTAHQTRCQRPARILNSGAGSGKSAGTQHKVGPSVDLLGLSGALSAPPRQAWRTPIGTHGGINTRRAGGRVVAETRVRDLDGRLRQVRASGPTAAAAKTRLMERIRERPSLPSSGNCQAKGWLPRVPAPSRRALPDR